MAAGKSQKDAYTAGGYKYNVSTAVRFFKREDVHKRVQELLTERYAAETKAREIGVQKAGLTEEWIVSRLMYLTERSLRGQPVLDKDGKQVPGQFTGKPDGPTAARCLELAAKMKGLLVNRHEFGQPGDFDRMDDAGLDNEIARLMGQLGYEAKPGGKTTSH